MPSDNESYIEELKKTLYSRGSPDVRTRRKLRFTDRTPQVNTSWKEPEEEPIHPVLNQRYEDHSMSFLTKILIGSALFCVLAVGLGAYLFFNGANLISANNIDIIINGPVSVSGGTAVPFDIVVTNKNNIDLQLVDLAVDFPEGTTDPVDPSTELKTFRELIGDIPAGSSAKKTVKAIMFGEENMQKSIVATVSYKVKGSSSLFTKNKSYDVLISSSPVSIAVDSFKEVSSGQEFDMKVTLKSNSEETLKNILLKGQYPFGYTYISSDIQPLSGNTTWKLGDLPAGASRKVTIHGKLTGEDNDERAFKFIAGAQSSTDAKAIGTQYLAIEQDITVQKPFVSLAISVNGDKTGTDYVGQFGRDNSVEISWSNNLPVSISNMVITVKLSGSAYDKLNIEPQEGYWRSATDEIVWNQQTNSEFASVGAGSNGQVAFRITPKDITYVSSSITNPQISISANVSGNRTQETGVSSNLTAVANKIIRVASNVSLSGRVVKTVGPFKNTGPVPPKVDQASTYTVIWDVDNTANAVGNASVTATLPPYVKWLNAFNPTNENVTYDPNSNRITWKIGDISTYTLNSNQRKELAFQISATPPVNQVGQPLVLVNEAVLTATDSFAGAELTSSQDDLSSRFSTDPTYKDGDGNVSR